MKAGEFAPPSLPCRIVSLLEPGAVAEHFARQEGPVEAVSTPLPAWNRACRDEGGGEGLARGWHVTLAGATGVGKSLFALNVGAEAIRHGERVAFISLEMSCAQLATRLYAILTDTDVRSLERGASYSPEVADRVAARVAEIREETGGHYLTNDRPLYKPEHVLGLMRYLHESRGCRFVILDYMQLAAARDGRSLHYAVSDISAQVRQFAQSFNVVTIGLSQLNRATSFNYDASPRVQGLMSSSSLENDSDQVLLLDHSRYHKAGSVAMGYALLAKNRHGASGEIPVGWDYRTLRLRQAMGEEVEEWLKRGKGMADLGTALDSAEPEAAAEEQLEMAP